MPLEESVKEQIKEWAGEDRDRGWLIKNLEKVSGIYCNKPVIINDGQGTIMQEIKKMNFDDNGFLIIQGQGYMRHIHVGQVYFHADYSMLLRDFWWHLDHKEINVILKEFVPFEQLEKYCQKKKWLLEENKKYLLNK